MIANNTREWLLRTKEDLDAAALVLTVPSPLVRTALFHCQQAVEKAMKAFLTWHDAAFREVHNLDWVNPASASIPLWLPVSRASQS
jgi:HEPN domain-containing protein